MNQTKIWVINGGVGIANAAVASTKDVPFTVAKVVVGTVSASNIIIKEFKTSLHSACEKTATALCYFIRRQGV